MYITVHIHYRIIYTLCIFSLKEIDLYRMEFFMYTTYTDNQRQIYYKKEKKKKKAMQ